MTIIGAIFMILGWGFVIALTVFTFVRTLRSKEEEDE